MINSITLTNWRTHKESTLEFGKGTNVIIGVMGSGKSSIVNAISYSLFGTFPQLKNRSVSLEEIIMNKPNPQNQAKTKLEFTQNDKTYIVERIIKRDSANEANLYEDKKLIAGPKQKDVNEKVEALLGINYELFSRAVYAEQNEMDFFLKLTPSERKKKFDEILELEKYEEARKNATTLQNNLTKENKQREEFIKQQKETIQAQEEEKIKKLIQEEETSCKNLEEKKRNIQTKLPLIEKEYNILLEKEKTEKKLEENITKIVERINSIKEFLKKNELINEEKILSEINSLKKEEELTKNELIKKEELLQTEIKKEKEYKKIKEILIKFESKIESLKEEFSKTEALPKNIKEKIEQNKKLEEELKIKKMEIEEMEKKVLAKEKEIGEEIKVKEFEINKINKEEKEISQLSGKCPSCKQELTEVHKNNLKKELNEKKLSLEKILNELIKEKNANSEEKTKINKEIQEIKEKIEQNTKEKYQLESFEKKAKEIEEKTIQLKDLEEETPKLKEQIKELEFSEEKLENIRQKKNLIEKKQSELINNIKLKEQELKNAIEKKNKEEQLKKEEKELEINKKNRVENSFDKKILEKTREEMYALKSEFDVLTEKIKSKTELMNSYNENLKKIELIRKTIEEQEKQVAKSLQAGQQIGIFSNCLTATQIELREVMLDTINKAMTTIWQEIYPYKDFTNARLSVVSQGYDLEVMTRDNEWIRVEGILSGGERSAAALCIRIAFSLVLTKKLSMLILDEPTHNLDSNAVAKLSEMLREEMPKLVEQIFIITHEKNLEKAASSNLYLLKRDKDNDGATQIEDISMN
ncbi:MAG: AAA family ATPase [Candidatus Iainarchaeum sp.]|jgi:exonuclease SbcC|nr:MAG: DNA double-strand break repair Rad50 ATPase [archaeon ADurb.Bin336]